MGKKYVCIEFESGSKGVDIAEQVALVCGLPCYGKEIFEFVKNETNLTNDDIKAYIDSLTNSFLFSYYMVGEVRKNNTDSLSKEGQICLAEQTTIRKLAAKSSAVFIGHCASSLLKDFGQVINVYVKAAYEDKKSYVSGRCKNPLINIENTINKLDNVKGRYYFYNTGKRWSDKENYDLILDSSKSDISECVSQIKILFDEL